MVLKLDNIDIHDDTNITCTDINGSILPVDRIQFEGVTVWEKQTTPAGTIIFESSTAGTYNIEIPVDGLYQIIAVGAGGNGGKVPYGTLVLSVAGYGGGYINVYKTLTAGTYTGVVGVNTGSRSQDTTFDSLLADGGGYVYPDSSLNNLTNDVSSADSVIDNVETLVRSGSNYQGYGSGGQVEAAGTPGYLKIIKA